MKNSVGFARPFDDPLPADLHDLDAITFLFSITTRRTSTSIVPRWIASWSQRKPGGTLVIADHAAQAGSDITVGKTLHRIDESTLRREVEAVGFKLIAEGDFWHHPEDAGDFSALRALAPVDEFVLNQKPM
jgi:predicted methyltransferase